MHKQDKVNFVDKSVKKTGKKRFFCVRVRGMNMTKISPQKFLTL